MACPQAGLPNFTGSVYFPHTHSQAHSDGPDFVCAARIFTRLPGFRSTIPGFQLPAQISPKQPGLSILTAYDAPDLPTRQQFHYPIPGSHSILPGFPRHVPGFARICPDLPGFARIARISNHQAGYLSLEPQLTPLASRSVTRQQVALLDKI